MIKRKSGEQTCVVQAWQYSKTLGQINIIFDAKGRLLSCKGNPELLLGSQIKVKKSDNWVQPSKKTYQRVANYVNEDDKLQFVSKSSVGPALWSLIEKQRAFGDKIIGYFDKAIYTQEAKTMLRSVFHLRIKVRWPKSWPNHT